MKAAPSQAAQIIVTIIPIVGIVMGAVIVFFYLLWDHKRKMFMIEKGIYQNKPFDFDFFSLFAGLLLFGVGASLTLFFYLKQGLSYSLLGGLIPLSTGISLILFFMSRRKLS